MSSDSKRVFSSIEQFGVESSQPVSMALGMFDGVHIGHKEVLESSISCARYKKGNSVAFTFPKHPARYLRPQNAPNLLMNSDRKAEQLLRDGMDFVIIREFDQHLAEISASDFPQFLKSKIPTLFSLTVGRNFRFGKGREGDSTMLKEIAKKSDLSVQVVDSITYSDLTVSSSRIREELYKGDMVVVKQMLGRWYSVLGKVLPGKALGRQIGFPTLNLDWNVEASPPFGVYAGIVKNQKAENALPSIANFGLRPTVEEQVLEPKLEIHVLGELNTKIWGTGSLLEMEMRHFIRPEKKFESVEQLKAQIFDDSLKAKEILQIN